MDEVDEEVDGVGDVVTVAAALLLDDHLGVPHDEATEQEQSSPQVSLKIFDSSYSRIHTCYFERLNVVLPRQQQSEQGPVLSTAVFFVVSY